jgi:hypothetical protein
MVAPGRMTARSSARVDLAHRLDLLRGAWVAVVHDVGGARLAGELGLLRAAHGGDDLRAGPGGQLDGEVADGSGAAGDQHLAPIDGTVGEQAPVRGHRGHAQAGAELERGACGQRHRLPGRHHRPLRRRAPLPAGRRQPEPDALAGPAGVDALTDRLDHPCAVLVRDLKAVDRARGRAAAALVVGRVDGGDRHLHQDLTGPGCWPLHLRHGQYLGGRAMSLVPGGSHGLPPSRAHRFASDPLTATGTAKRWPGRFPGLPRPPWQHISTAAASLFRPLRARALRPAAPPRSRGER